MVRRTKPQGSARAGYYCCLAGLALLVLNCAAYAGTTETDHALGITIGQGTLFSRLSDRSYAGFYYRQAWQPAWSARLPNDMHLSLTYTVSRFHGCRHGVCDSLTDVGLGPTLRFLPGIRSQGSWYVDMGLGLHLISQTYIDNEIYSTAVQFSELLGIGYEFGNDGRYDLGFSFMHESNADIKTPNDGMNFVLFQLAIHW